MKLHAGHIEVAVAGLFNYRVYAIVPNVSYGWGLAHEADLICVSKAMIVTEVEIKVSAGDLRADFKKHHNHSSKRIHRLVYAVPESLVELAKELVPKHCGIIEVYTKEYYPKSRSDKHTIEGFFARWVRGAKKNSNPPITEKQYAELLRLGCMRIWTLKHHNNGKRSTS